MTPRKRTTPDSPAPEAAAPKAAKPRTPAKPRGKVAASAVTTEPEVEPVAVKKGRCKAKEMPAPSPRVDMDVVAAPASKKGARAKVEVLLPVPEDQAAGIEPVSAAPEAGLDGHTAKVLEAIRGGHAVELIFIDSDANPPRTFEPRQLIFDVFTCAWFMWGWDRRYNAERHHRVDALAAVNLVDGHGRAAQGPFPEGTPANQIGGWRGGEPIFVKALLQKQWVFAVRQAPAPFPDFCMEDGEDGKVSVSFTATDLRAIARWCMQFGDGLQVLEPQRLTDRIKQVAQAWGAKLAPVAPPKPTPPPPAAPRTAPPEPPQRASHRPERERAPKPKDPETSQSAKPSKVEVRFDRL